MHIVLLGKTGQVGWELQRALAPLGRLTAPDRASADLANPAALRRLLRQLTPDIIVNAAAYTSVDKAETERELARRVNADAPAVLAEEARRTDAWLVHYSTDYIFDGLKPTPYVEDDRPAPLSAYGETKLAGEGAVRATHVRHLIFRTSWVYAARGSNFPKTILRLAGTREDLTVVADQRGAPTSAELIADITALALYRICATAADGGASLAGTYNLTARGVTTWFDYAKYVVELALQKGVPLKTTPDRIRAVPTDGYPLPARRPANSQLDTARLQAAFGFDLPHWRYHVARLVDELLAGGSISRVEKGDTSCRGSLYTRMNISSIRVS
jgi:dTDP-4-dehydrorhamnose reductase